MKVSVYYFFYLGLIPLFFSCKEKNTDLKEIRTIEIEKVSVLDKESPKEFSFISQPFRTSELSFRVSGPIQKLDLYSGNHYSKGSVISEIDPRDFKVRKERAAGVYNQAKSEYERIKFLFEKNNISASTYEKAKSDYINAKTNFATYENELNDTQLIAPFNGYIGEVYMEKYQEVKASQPVVSFIDIEQLKIEIYVTQEIAYKAKNIKTIDLFFDTLPDKTYTADIIEISKSTTQNNLSYMLTALLPNKDGKLLAGMSGKAVIKNIDSGEKGKIAIPQSALTYQPSVGDFVWVLDSPSMKIEKRIVERGELLPDRMITINKGLAPEEIVATSSLRFLSDGMKVSTTEGTKK